MLKADWCSCKRIAIIKSVEYKSPEKEFFKLVIARFAGISILIFFLSWRKYHYIEINIKPQRCRYDVISYCMLITRYIKTNDGSFILVMKKNHSSEVSLIHLDFIIEGTYYDNNEFKEIKRKKQIVLEFLELYINTQ